MFEKATEPEEDLEDMLPPLCTITVTVPAENAYGFATEVWEGHAIENTQVGGLLIQRIYRVSKTRLLQKMVVGYAPGEWQKVTQTMDVVEYTEPSKLSLN